MGYHGFKKWEGVWKLFREMLRLGHARPLSHVPDEFHASSPLPWLRLYFICLSTFPYHSPILPHHFHIISSSLPISQRAVFILEVFKLFRL